MPDGHVIKKPEDLSQSRWKPVNELKNGPVTLQLHMSGTRLYPRFQAILVLAGSFSTHECNEASLTLDRVLFCTGSDKRYTIPETAPSEEAVCGGYWDDVDDVLLGSTTLSEMVKRVKAKVSNVPRKPSCIAQS